MPVQRKNRCTGASLGPMFMSLTRTAGNAACGRAHLCYERRDSHCVERIRSCICEHQTDRRDEHEVDDNAPRTSSTLTVANPARASGTKRYANSSATAAAMRNANERVRARHSASAIPAMPFTPRACRPLGPGRPRVGDRPVIGCLRRKERREPNTVDVVYRRPRIDTCSARRDAR